MHLCGFYGCAYIDRETRLEFNFIVCMCMSMSLICLVILHDKTPT